MTGGIPSRPQEQEFRSFCRLPSGEAVPLRASRPLRAASPRGLHGPGNSTGAQDARAGGGEAAAAESRGGASRQLRSCLPGSRRALQTPGLGLRPRSEAHPPLEPARRPRAPGSRPGRHLPGLEATSSSSQTLPTVTCTAGPGAAQLLQRVQSAERGRRAGTGYRRHGPAPRPSPGRHPSQPGGGSNPGRTRGGAEPGPASAQRRARPARPLALTPFPPCRDLSDRLLDEAFSLQF